MPLLSRYLIREAAVMRESDFHVISPCVIECPAMKALVTKLATSLGVGREELTLMSFVEAF